jgi:hypothetical protein
VKKAWNVAIVKAWYLESGLGMAADARRDETANEAIWSSIGAMLYAGMTGDGAETEAAFKSYLEEYVGWDEPFVIDHVDELRIKSEEALRRDDVPSRHARV